MKGDKLTGKQQAFCREYVKNGYNGMQAAISAGYSKKGANVIASNLLTNINIKARVEHHKTHLEELLNLSKSRVLKEHMKIAMSSIAHLHNTWIERKAFEELTDDQKECIAEITTQTRNIMSGEQAVEVEFVKIKLYDKQKALDSITKLMGYDAPVRSELNVSMPTAVTLIRTDRSKADVSRSEAEIPE